MNNTLTARFPFPFPAAIPSFVSFGLMLRIILCLLAVSIAFLLGFYVFQLGDLTHKSFIIRDYELKAEALLNNNTDLYVDSVNNSSLQELEQKINGLNFVKAGQIKYIPIYPKQLVRNVK